MYEYQKNNRFFAQIADRIKEVGAKELNRLGAQRISPAYRGIYFDADKESLYRINYCTRLASRILAPLVWFNCNTTDQLYKKAKRINWLDIIPQESTFAIFSNVSNSKIRNSQYASLRLKDAIVDSFIEKTKKRPNINPKTPDIWLNLHITSNKAIISLDTSGGSLHKRGYRKTSVEAPMQETVAAAIVKYTEWDGSAALYDPMCGSGTLLSEALMHFCRIPAGIFRSNFGFKFMPDYDSGLWAKVKKELDRQIKALPEERISGSDSSARSIDIAKTNILNLPHGAKIKLRTLDFRKISSLSNRVIITNPPYGIRMGEKQKLDLLYKDFGDFLKNKCKGSTAYIYFGKREFIKKIGLKPSWKKPIESGGLDGRLVKYDLF